MGGWGVGGGVFRSTAMLSDTLCSHSRIPVTAVSLRKAVLLWTPMPVVEYEFQLFSDEQVEIWFSQELGERELGERAPPYGLQRCPSAC